MKRAAECLLSGAIVYVAMAAQAAGGCSGGPEVYLREEPGGGQGGHGGVPFAGAGAPGEGGFGGAPGSSGEAGAVATAGGGGSSGEGGSGGIFDPVPHADAKSGTRLKALVQRGADGSEQSTFTWQDTGRNNEVCTFQVAADGKTRCMPGGTIASGYFADTNCAVPALLTPNNQQCAGAATPYVVVGKSLGCTSGVSLHERGQPVSGLYARASNGACVTTTIPAGYSVYATGPEIQPSSFVEVSVVALPLGLRVFGRLGRRACMVQDAAIGHRQRDLGGELGREPRRRNVGQGRELKRQGDVDRLRPAGRLKDDG